MKSTTSATPNKQKAKNKVVTTTNCDKKIHHAEDRRHQLQGHYSKPTKSLNATSMYAREEHGLQMKILEEKLIQKKMKTELLKLQVQREAGIEWEN